MNRSLPRATLSARRRRPLAAAYLLAAWAILACTSADAAPGRDSAAAKAAGPVADSLSDSVVVTRADQGRYLGRDSAPIWIVMISDFECPYCKMWHDSTMATVRREYIETGRARMAYLNMPLPQHRHARVAASAAMCAGVQNRFWDFADSLFARQRDIAASTDARPILDSVARTLHLDTTAWRHCRESNAINAIVEGDARQAARAGIQSTPSFFIGSFLLQGAVPWPDFKRAVDSALVLAARKR